MADSLDEVPLQEHTQHRRQMGEVGSHCAAEKLWYSGHYWNVVEQSLWSVDINSYKLSNSYRWGMRGELVLYVKKWVECEEMFLKNSRNQAESLEVGIRDQQGEPCVWWQLQATWSRGACWWSLCTPVTGNVALTVSCRAWEISAALTPAVKIAWWAVGKPGDSWSALRIAF